ncbi:XRE family transcriptional regulator [Actinomadura sp. LOL_016]|uniref:XRE family transcriptional regulator n=1 Tax=unclassified Actinomadura TaxID=2626254 RepID=UPI003A8046AE
MVADRMATAARLRALREETPYWSRSRLAELLREAAEPVERAGLAHVSGLAAMIKTWERGRHLPDHRYRRLYCEVAGISEYDLFGPTGEGSNTDPVGSVDLGPFPDEGNDDVKRRAAMQILAALGAGATVPSGALEEIFGGLDTALHEGADLDRWERTVWEYGRLFMDRPAGTLVDDLSSDIVAVGRLLNRPLPPATSAGLLRVSAGLSGLLGMEFDSLGQRRAGRIAWGAAARAADASGDRDLAAWTRAKEADGALWSGMPHPIAERLVSEAIAVAGDRPGHGIARAHTVRANLAAERGDEAEARAALADLTQTLEHAPSAVTADPSGHVGEAFLRWHESYVNALLGDARANDAVDRGISLMPSVSRGRGGHLSLQLIRSVWLVRDGEVQTGLQHAVEALDQEHYITPASQRHLGDQVVNALPEGAANLPTARKLRALTAAGASR